MLIDTFPTGWVSPEAEAIARAIVTAETEYINRRAAAMMHAQLTATANVFREDAQRFATLINSGQSATVATSGNVRFVDPSGGVPSVQRQPAPCDTCGPGAAQATPVAATSSVPLVSENSVGILLQPEFIRNSAIAGDGDGEEDATPLADTVTEPGEETTGVVTTATSVKVQFSSKEKVMAYFAGSLVEMKKWARANGLRGTDSYKSAEKLAAYIYKHQPALT